MRRFSQEWQSSHLINMASNIYRRRSWFLENASVGQLANLAVAGTEFIRGRTVMRAWPTLLKVDIAPACNLGCTFCVHSPAAIPGNNLLADQQFSGLRMSVADYAGLLDQVRGRSAAVSLYYLGDPLVHPQLAEICSVTRSAGLNAHVSTNFSFRLSDERVHELVTSGLTHLTVCVDGLSQKNYELTRVGGRIDLVLDNLDRVLATRRRLRQQYPRVEVQYIKFQHNLGEVAAAEEWCRQHGVDQFTDYWGNLHNYADVAPGRYRVFGPKPKRVVPQCTWPHFALQVKYNGDVIPCCYYRHTEQYRDGGDDRAVGNVLHSGLREVWNSVAYQRLRTLVADPTSAQRDSTLENEFCHGCPTVFRTDVEDHELVADRHEWNELYVRDGRGRVVRR
jgi:MoaA/NifB/PqqE/SkfB family radical SAM enzyme